MKTPRHVIHIPPAVLILAFFMKSRTKEKKNVQKIVIMYGLKAPDMIPADSSAQALAQVHHHDAIRDVPSVLSPWRRFFEPLERPEPDALTKAIAIEAEKLRSNWVKLYKTSSKDDRLNLKSFNPTFESTVDLINSVSENLQTKRSATAAGKITNGFHSFCDKLDSHATFLKLLPEGNEYVSLFTGSLSAIVKASVNHKQVAEELSEALHEISEDIAETRVDLSLFHTPELLTKIADLYSHIFIFLSSYMDHLMRKRTTRFIESFNENASRKFKDDIKRIKDRFARIKNMVQQKHIALARDTNFMAGKTNNTVEQIAADLRVGQEGNERHQAELTDFTTRIREELIFANRERRALDGRIVDLGFGMMKLLETSASKHQALENKVQMLEAQRLSDPGLLPNDITSFRRHTRTPSPSGSFASCEYLFEDVALSSALLEDYFHRDRVRIIEDVGPATAPPEVIRRLVDWTIGATSRLLWINGPYIIADDEDNPVTMLAATFVEFVAQSELPVMSYFCEQRRKEALRPGNTAESQGLMALISALIRQTIELLPPAFDADVELSTKRISRIDGGISSYPEALSLLSDLMTLLPQADKVFCIIDGINWLDDDATEAQIQRLVEVLQTSKFRVLLTTVGRVGSLLDVIPEHETITVDSFDGRDESVSLTSLLSE